MRFVEARWHSGDADKECLVASGMGGIMDGIFAELDECCRERLKQVTAASIDERVRGHAARRSVMGFGVGTSVPVITVFVQGLLSFFSPCVLPLVPLYLGYLAGGVGAHARGRNHRLSTRGPCW